jgi:hypothetical protein
MLVFSRLYTECMQIRLFPAWHVPLMTHVEREVMHVSMHILGICLKRGTLTIEAAVLLPWLQHREAIIDQMVRHNHLVDDDTVRPCSATYMVRSHATATLTLQLVEKLQPHTRMRARTHADTHFTCMHRCSRLHAYLTYVCITLNC